MESILLKILGFILVTGVLVTVHEFGHFWVARKLGVKVLRFSIGFGKPLLRWYGRREGRAGTEYVLAAIPLGGYVKMLDERESEVPLEQQHMAFNRQKLWVRSAIVAAGPAFNLVFAVIAFWGVLVIGETGLKSLIAEVKPGTPAAEAGFARGDQILQINGEPTPAWAQVFYEMASASATGDSLDFVVADESGSQRHLRIDSRALGDFAELPDPLASLGLEPDRPKLPLLVGEVQADGAAAAAGMKTGDLLVSADGKKLADWNQWVELVRASPGQLMNVEVQRDGVPVQLQLIPAALEVDGKAIGRIGAASQPQPELWVKYRVVMDHGWFEAVPLAVQKTWDFSALSLKVLWRILSGKASVKNLGGPITMADAAGHAVAAGFIQFLKLLAIISISLGVMNLLPVPILDGGHLLYFLYEAVSGSPVSERVMVIGQQIGMALLLALMGLVMYQDILRISG